MRFIKKRGAVYWSAGWERHYTMEPLNGYLYVSSQSVKYRLRIEKIIRNVELPLEELKFIPACRKDWIKKISTWVKITDIIKLREPVDPMSMVKWKNREPIKSTSTLQSAVKVIDEFWE